MTQQSSLGLNSDLSAQKLKKNLEDKVLRVDRYRLHSQLNRLKGQPQKMVKLLSQIEQLHSQFEQRLKDKPEVELQHDLPVSQQAKRIEQTILGNQVTIIAGETGSGKTTQIPQICLQAGLGKYGSIGCTQPRRIAAKSVAIRVAEELKTPLGQAVGYQVRFDDKFNPNGWIKFMTDGILLQQTLNDRWLNEYDVIIIDEAHERSLNVDFLLGFLKKLCEKRSDLKLIITSATIDTEKFSKHFAGAPVIQVSGRSYPVDIEYRELEKNNLELDQGILRCVDEIYARPEKGDVLVFLPGEREIKRVQDLLQRKHLPNTEVLPLYARLTSDAQMRIFSPDDKRRIVLSTNVAETSLTVPRIGYVIDSGQARISRYSARSKIQGLQVEAIAQDAANQRAGRCGRLSSGVCYRLYSEADFEARAEHTDPEILRTSLASVILQTQVLKLGEFDEFPFIDRPDNKMIADGYQLLFELQAIDEGQQLTSIGQRIAQLPIDVQLARILLQAEQFGCLHEVSIIVSALSIQDVRERPLEWAQAADKAHEEFANDHSDFMSYLTLWERLAEERKQRKNSGFKKWCRDHFISIKRYMEWKDIYRQLTQLLKQRKFQKNASEASFQAIHKSLLTGFISHVGQLYNSYEYEGPRNRKFQIFPGSALFNSQPSWIMAASIVHTTQIFARTVASIRPEWVREMGEHLLNTYHYGPYWSKKQGTVLGYQRTKLLGLTLEEKQRIHYGPKDPSLSRKLFIEKGLVERQLHTRLDFYHHNNRLIQTVIAEEDRQRKKDLLIDEQRLIAMYDAVIPHAVYSEVLLRKWVQKNGDASLKFKSEDLYQTQLQEPLESQFPEHIQIRQLCLPLSYQFMPGQADDGVTAQIQITWLNALNGNDFEFLVPGLIEEKIEFIIRGFPKSLRRGLIPIAEYATEIAQRLDKEKPFYQQLIQIIEQLTGLNIALKTAQDIALPAHLMMRYCLLDEAGEVLVCTRDFNEIVAKYGDQANQSFQQTASEEYQMSGATDWVFGEISPRVQLNNGLIAFSGLYDEQESVGIQLFESESQARDAHIQGLKKLIKLKYPKILKQSSRQSVALKSAFVWDTLEAEASLMESLTDALLEKTIVANLPIYSQQQFDQLSDVLKATLYAKTYEWLKTLEPVLEQWYALWQKLDSLQNQLNEKSVDDMNLQLDYLIYPECFDYVNLQQLKHYGRYLRGLDIRIDTALHSPQKESDKLQQLNKISQPFYLWCEEHTYSKELQAYLMLLEEYRVSVFAQKLGTQEKVSERRLQTAFKQMKATGSIH